MKYFLPLLALAGLLFGIYVVSTGAKEVPAAQPVVDPARPPFARYIAGSGIVEASTDNVEISTSVPGVLTDIKVHVGQRVRRGEPLFHIDTRDLEAELTVRQAELELKRAKIPESAADLDEAKRMYDIYNGVIDQRAITQEELSKRRFALEAANSRFLQAKLEITTAEARLTQTRVEIDRRTVTSPVDGTVLQSKILVGEYAQLGTLTTPLMIIGDTQTVHVRTSIDENDAWRFTERARAYAFVRGNPKLHTEVKFVRVEPFVIPKMSLTGDPIERVDTRVLQVLFAFPPDRLSVFVGQQMDVFIEVPDAVVEASESTPAPAATTSKPATTSPSTTRSATQMQ